MTDKTRNSIFQYRLNCNGNTYLMMKIHVVKDRVYLGIEGMVEPYVVIEGYPIELSIVLGPSNTTLIEAIRIVEKKE